MPAANRPRAIWTGAISFGLVNAPVRMYTAITEKDLRFNQLHEPDGGRIGYVKVCKVDNEPVPADEIVKGYEISKGEYVQMSDEDFQAARGEQHRGITIHDFVPADQIDPIYFERTYYLGPEEGAGEAIYALLVEAMERSGLSAIATYVHHDRENLACLRVREGVITLERMFFDDEVRSTEGIVPSQSKVDAKQLKMAEDLIGAYTSDFEPDRYKDTYRERLLAIVEQKRDGKTTKAPEPEAAPPAPDLVAALTASLEVARKEREAGKKATGKAGAKSDGKANGKPTGGRSRAKAGTARSKSA
jgi:DNA end-binding protein Ku